MIILSDFCYSYNNDLAAKPALNNISLKISAGEYISIMGPNGSGKSTLGKIISGIIPSQGEAFNFKNINAASEEGNRLVRNSTGMVFQNPDNQMVAMTVESEIAFPLENICTPSGEIREKVDRLIDTFKLEMFVDRPPLLLSGGERQKVIIASVLAGEPECLILDEPTSLLDPQGRKYIMTLLEDIFGRKGEFSHLWIKKDIAPTIINITQFPEEAFLSERLIVMDEGNIVYDDSPESVFKRVFDDDSGIIPLPKLFQYELVKMKQGLLPETSSIQNNTSAVASGHAYIMKDIYFSYKLPWGDIIPALNEFNCEIQKGRVTGLMGITGSGKSSAARLMAFLEKPDRGSIIFNDEEIAKHVSIETKRKAGLSFQFPERQFFCETVYDEIAFALKLRGTDKALIDRAVKESLGLVGLEYTDFVSRDPFTLSGGEKRRIGIAITLAMAPEVVILDEPTSGLDGEGIGYLIKLISNLTAKNKTIIIISHNLEFILNVCDDILFFTEGRVSGKSTVEKILQGAFPIEKQGIILTEYIGYVIKTACNSDILLKSLPSPEEFFILSHGY
ncbi:MAG: ATP-binding cassette domain-containing protein [candidate division Zixibacteria bacterium]|nr:ATP-binding cassette domain-containing protein [candidate division Zixibacteria bacterium]